MQDQIPSQPRQPKRPRGTRRYDRFKATYDLTQALADAIYAVAVQLRCSQSDVAMHMMAEGLRRYYANELNLVTHRTKHSFSLRFANKLAPAVIPALPEHIAAEWARHEQGDDE